MIRLNLVVEGETERGFVTRLLVPHLSQFGVCLSRPPLTAQVKKKGRVHRGGLHRYAPFKNDIQRRLKEDGAPDVRFATMVDLYGLPADFPGYGEAHGSDPYARVKCLEAALDRDIGDARFFAYIQLHEFETLLLSNPAGFLSYYPQRAKSVDSLKRMCGQFGNPELIDDGEQTAPSKRIGTEIPEYLDAKPTAGPFVASAIGLDTIRARCRHFNEWLTRLERLGTR